MFTLIGFLVFCLSLVSTAAFFGEVEFEREFDLGKFGKLAIEFSEVRPFWISLDRSDV